MFKRILVPVDGSDLTHKAVEVALSLADRFESDVVLLHIRRKAASLEHGEAEADLDDIEAQTKRLIATGLSKLRNDHTVTTKQVKEIAEAKWKDLNANDVEAAMKIILGSARSMGIEVK